jgi:hypothetical protein
LPVGAEPPVSTPAPPVLRAADPPLKVPPAPQVTIEAQLLRFRLIAPDQMTEAMKIHAETGKPVAETVVERGWISEDDLAQVMASLGGGETAPAAPAPPAPVAVAPPPPPAPVSAPPPPPAPVALPEPPAPVVEAAPPPPPPAPELPPAAAAEPEPMPLAPAPEPPKAEAPPAPQPRGSTRLVVKLRSGEELEAGSYDDSAAARARAKELVDQVQADDVWLFVAGRSVDPEEIDSIFLAKS